MSCNCEFNSAREVLERVKAKGVANEKMEVEYKMECECGNIHTMNTFVSECEQCHGIFAVTPCSQHQQEKIVFVK